MNELGVDEDQIKDDLVGIQQADFRKMCKRITNFCPKGLTILHHVLSVLLVESVSEVETNLNQLVQAVDQSDKYDEEVKKNKILHEEIEQLRKENAELKKKGEKSTSGE